MYAVIWCLTLFGSNAAELITLSREETVTYVQRGDDLGKAGFIEPLTESAKKNSNSNSSPSFEWVNDDWTRKHVNQSHEGPALDKRWEDFPLIKTNYQRFTQQKTISFSLYSPERITFHIDNSLNYQSDYYVLEPIKTADWMHYSIISRNNKMYIFENFAILKVLDGFVAHQVIVKTQETFWKIHDYSFRWANVISHTPTVVKIPQSEKSHILLFASLCKECMLDVKVKEKNKVINWERMRGLTDTNILHPWKSNLIEIEPYENNEIIITRRTTDGEENGHWSIDLHFCDEVSNFTVPNTTRPKYKILNDIRDRVKRSAPSNCSVGELGKDCSLSCRNVLGDTYPTCENHYICDDSECSCAWGFKGELCEQKCDPGEWGLGCKQTCDCRKCNSINGMCDASLNSRQPVLPDLESITKNTASLIEKSSENQAKWNELWMLLLVIAAIINAFSI